MLSFGNYDGEKLKTIPFCFQASAGGAAAKKTEKKAEKKAEEKAAEPQRREVKIVVAPQSKEGISKTIEYPKSDVKSGEPKTHEVKINVAPKSNEGASKTVEESKPEEKIGNDAIPKEIETNGEQVLNATNAEEKKSESADPQVEQYTSDESKSETEPRKEETQPEVAKKDEVQPEVAQKEESKPETEGRKKDPLVNEALQAMLNMGFTDEGGWLTKLLETKHGNVDKALDVLQPAYTACN